MTLYEFFDFNRMLSDMAIRKYVEDLSDAELLLRPHPKCHHIAFQLGHLISSEAQLIEAIAPGRSLPLPTGFHETYSKANEWNDDAAKFLTKDEYLKLYAESSANTTKIVHELTAERLSAPGPEPMRAFMPKVGNVVSLLAQHPLMHAGQFVPVRRETGKPVVI